MKLVTYKTNTPRPPKPEPDSKYEQQALAWLRDTDSTLEIAFDHTGKYWPDDKDERDVYRVTLTRQGHSYTFTFGQSLMHSGKLEDRQQPSAYDILACLEGHSPGVFEDFCCEYGYSTDSRKAEATWKACVEQYLELEAMYSEDERQALSEIC